MKRIILGVLIGVVLSHLFIAVSNDLRLRSYGLSMFGLAEHQKEFCAEYGKKPVITWDFDYGIYTHSSCK